MALVLELNFLNQKALSRSETSLIFLKAALMMNPRMRWTEGSLSMRSMQTSGEQPAFLKAMRGRVSKRDWEDLETKSFVSSLLASLSVPVDAAFLLLLKFTQTR